MGAKLDGLFSSDVTSGWKLVMIKERYWIGILLALSILIGTGCTSSTQENNMESDVPMSIQLSSLGFNEGDLIPRKYTCDGDDISPNLSWSGTPSGSQGLVMIMDDPDAPAGTWVHWVLYGLPSDLIEFPEGVQGLGVDGVNSWSRLGYGGPCPPPGTTHRYFFKLYALDMGLNLEPGATKEEIEKAMAGHILAWGQLMGTYERQNP
jgi:Raf kinase inhibitor-like YbhB/YbcL family protein